MSAINYKYISADNHLNTPWLPRNMWQDRLPSKFRETGPRVVDTDQGSFWFWEGKARKVSAQGSSWQKCIQDEFSQVVVPDDALPPSNPALVRAHMDLAGVYAGIFFGDTRKWLVDDPELRVAMYRAYNDFCLELSEHEPDRLIYLPNLPTADPEAALTEFLRLADVGVSAVEFSVCDVGRPLIDPIWEPLWEGAAARGIVICSHIGHGAGVPRPSNDGGAAVAFRATAPFVAARPIADMIFSGIFERHPRLKWVMAESRIGWLPFLFSFMDHQSQIRAADLTTGLSMLPSEYVRRNICFTVEEDPVGARLLHNEWSLLADTVMWGCDYPHPQFIWPDPDAVVERMMAGLDKGIRNEILYARAARLFGINFPENQSQ